MFLYWHTLGPLQVPMALQAMMFSNPATTFLLAALQHSYKPFVHTPSAAYLLLVVSHLGPAACSALTQQERRHAIWLRLCHVASSSIAFVLTTQIPSHAIPLDAPGRAPSDGNGVHCRHSARSPPADADKIYRVHDIVAAELQRVISLHKFDVGTFDTAKHGYFRIDTGDAEPYWESQRHLSHHERMSERVRCCRHHRAIGTRPYWASNTPLVVSQKDGDTRLCIDMRCVFKFSQRPLAPAMS